MLRMSRGWTGRLVLSGGHALYVGPAHDTSPHVHHAVQLSFALEDTFRLRIGSSKAWRRYQAAIIPSDRRHQADGGGALMAFVYLDPETPEARSLLHQYRRTELNGPVVEKVIDVARDFWRHASADADAVCVEIIRLLAPSSPQNTELDPRIRATLNLLRALPERRMPLREIAGAIAISPGRLVHLFRQETGLPIRRYLLWLRLGDALNGIAAGASLTDAAHAAGFADSAHLSRTFREMIGVPPSALAKYSQIVQAPSPRPV